MLYVVDPSSKPQNQAREGGSNKRDLAARNGPEKDESKGSEVGKRKGHSEEI